MKLIIEGERTSLDLYCDGRVWLKPRWKNWSWSKKYPAMISTPFFFVDCGIQFWHDKEEREQPKYSRSKRFSITLEYGTVKGYKE